MLNISVTLIPWPAPCKGMVDFNGAILNNYASFMNTRITCVHEGSNKITRQGLEFLYIGLT